MCIWPKIKIIKDSMILSNEEHWNNVEYIYSTYLQSLVVQCLHIQWFIQLHERTVAFITGGMFSTQLLWL